MTYALGLHKAVAVEAQLGKSTNDNPQVAVTFRFTEGPNENKRITWYGFFTEKTTKRTIASLRYCGWRGNDLSDLSSMLFDSDTSQTVELDLQTDTYEGKTRTRVQWVNRLGGGGAALANPMGDQERADFAEKMMGRVTQLAEEDPDCASDGAPAEKEKDGLPF